jgi:radical SAM superfamily enzyme YgiQ (UPF0313 family)
VNQYRLGCVQTTRGCPFKCECCDIIVTYGRQVRAKPVAHVIAELQHWADRGVDFVTLADDNLVGDRAYCRQMLRAVADWNRACAVPISVYAEMSVDAVRDPELLELCRQANITEMFLGVETPRKAGLRETLKMQNVATDLVSAVSRSRAERRARCGPVAPVVVESVRDCCFRFSRTSPIWFPVATDDECVR